MQAGRLGWAFYQGTLERITHGSNLLFVSLFGVIGINIVTGVNWMIIP